MWRIHLLVDIFHLIVVTFNVCLVTVFMHSKKMWDVASLPFHGLPNLWRTSKNCLQEKLDFNNLQPHNTLLTIAKNIWQHNFFERSRTPNPIILELLCENLRCLFLPFIDVFHHWTYHHQITHEPFDVVAFMSSKQKLVSYYSEQ